MTGNERRILDIGFSAGYVYIMESWLVHVVGNRRSEHEEAKEWSKIGVRDTYIRI